MDQQAEVVSMEAGSASSEKSSRPANVRFEEYLSVVLIPHRDEYKQANCNLWWSKVDFFKSQKLANSEIRLLSVLQNIPMKEAKKILYQPEIDPEATCWQYLVRDPTPPSSAQNTPEISSHSRKSFKKASPSLDLEADQVVQEAEDAITPPFSPHPSSANRQRTSSWEEFLAKSVGSRKQQSEEEQRQYQDLHLCVPLAEKMLLAQDDCTSVRPFKKYESNSLTILMTLAPFMLPLLGYFFIQYVM